MCASQYHGLVLRAKSIHVNPFVLYLWVIHSDIVNVLFELRIFFADSNDTKYGLKWLSSTRTTSSLERTSEAL